MERLFLIKCWKKSDGGETAFKGSREKSKLNNIQPKPKWREKYMRTNKQKQQEKSNKKKLWE